MFKVESARGHKQRIEDKNDYNCYRNRFTVGRNE